jgi:hypothetical protein
VWDKTLKQILQKLEVKETVSGCWLLMVLVFIGLNFSVLLAEIKLPSSPKSQEDSKKSCLFIRLLILCIRMCQELKRGLQ